MDEYEWWMAGDGSPGALPEGPMIRPEDIAIAHAGMDMAHALDSEPNLRKIYDNALDNAKDCAMSLLDMDLESPEARDCKIEALSWIKVRSVIDEVISQGQEAAEQIQLADSEYKNDMQRTPIE